MKKSILSIGILFLIVILLIVPVLNAQIISKTIPINKGDNYSFPDIVKTVVWDNGMHYEGIHSTQYDGDYPFDCFQADDFLFVESTLVDGVYWHGGYWGGDPKPFDWCISFYLDDGSGQFPDGLPYSPSFAGPYCFTDEEIQKEENYPSHYYMKVDLPVTITFEAGQKYWISIWGQGALFPQCGWSFHHDYLLNPAVWGSDYFEVLYWTQGNEPYGSHHDKSFQLLFSVNNPPSAPEIDGPYQWPAGEEICFTFHSTDPDADDVKYIIDWGDGTTNETDFTQSCTPVEVCHTYEKMGKYVIKAMSVDIWGNSAWSTFEIEIPRTRTLSYHWFFERFPLLERLLTFLLL
jgi:hypothetical protein